MKLRYTEVLKSKRGWTLVETIVVMLIMTILIAGAAYVSVRNIKSANISQTASSLQIMSADIGDAYYEMGFPEIEPSEDGKAQFKNYLQELGQNYMNCTFDLDTVEVMSNGFSVEISDPTDSFENRIIMQAITTSDVAKYVLLISCGPDGIMTQDGYETQQYGDDIISVVCPKQ